MIEVNIPAGINDGQRIRMSGKGEPGTNGGPAGDLFIEIRVRPSDIFERDGDDLHMQLPISFVTAALGGEVSGKTFRLRGKGIANLRTHQPGDLYLHIEIETPVNLSDKQKKMLRDFDASLKEGGDKHNPKSQGFFDKVKNFFQKK